MSESSEATRKKAVFSSIAYATDLDGCGRELEAFRCYLACVQSICALLDGGLASVRDRTQMITMAKKCLERIQHISDSLGHHRSRDAGAACLLEDRMRRLRCPSPDSNLDPDPDPAWSTYPDPSAPSPDDSAGSDPDRVPSIEDNALVPSPPSEPDSGSWHGLPPQGTPHRPHLGTDALSPPEADRAGQQVGSTELNADEDECFFATDIVHIRHPIPKPSDDLDPSYELSPLDAARRENEKLVASYAARMQGIPLHIQHNLRLELQRRLTENRQIAARKHQAWLKRREEARQHHVEVAKRVFPVPEGSVPSSVDVQKQTTYAEVLQFEQTHPWTRQLRLSLDREPESPRAVENALLHMFLEKSHPLSKLRQRLQYSLFCKVRPLVEQHAHQLPPPLTREAVLAARRAAEAAQQRVYPPLPSDSDSEDSEGSAGGGDGGAAAAGPAAAGPVPDAAGDGEPPPGAPRLAPHPADTEEERQRAEAFRRHLRNVVSDAQESEQLLLTLAAAVHPALTEPLCRPTVQRLLLTPLWAHLQVLFRLAGAAEERRLAAAMCRLRAAGAEPPPEPAARHLLRALLLAASPADKCRLLVELVRLLCAAPDGPGGADLLLPRLTACVVHSGAPQLLSDLAFITEFTPDGSFQGEQGYCITSLQTVLMYLVQQQ